MPVERICTDYLMNQSKIKAWISGQSSCDYQVRWYGRNQVRECAIRVNNRCQLTSIILLRSADVILGTAWPSNSQNRYFLPAGQTHFSRNMVALPNQWLITLDGKLYLLVLWVWELANFSFHKRIFPLRQSPTLLFFEAKDFLAGTIQLSLESQFCQNIQLSTRLS